MNKLDISANMKINLKNPATAHTLARYGALTKKREIMKLIISLTLLLLTFKCNADQPKTNFYTEIHLIKNNIIIKNIPYTRWSNYGKVEVINGNDSSILYELDFFLRFENLFTEDAEYNAQINDWFIRGDTNSIVLSFYKRGKLIKKYKFSELGIPNKNLYETVSHTIWKKDAVIEGNILHILTHNNLLLSFDMTSGKLIYRDFSDRKNKLSTKKQVEYKVKYYYDIPEIYSLKTKDNQDLGKILSDKIFSSIDKDINIVYVSFIVNKKGNIDINKVEAFNDDTPIDRKVIEEIKNMCKNIVLTDISIPYPYVKWGKCITLKRPEPNN